MYNRAKHRDSKQIFVIFIFNSETANSRERTIPKNRWSITFSDRRTCMRKRRFFFFFSGTRRNRRWICLTQCSGRARVTARALGAKTMPMKGSGSSYYASHEESPDVGPPEGRLMQALRVLTYVNTRRARIALYKLLFNGGQRDTREKKWVNKWIQGKKKKKMRPWRKELGELRWWEA